MRQSTPNSPIRFSPRGPTALSRPRIATIWGTRTLHKNGRIFLVDAFRKRSSRPVNHLPVVGFYLINIGYVSLALAEKVKPGSESQVIEP